MTLMRVPAKDLRPGDFTLGSKQTVLFIDLLHAGPGKVKVTLKRETGERKVRSAEWSRSTMIGIDRPPLAASLKPRGATFERMDGSVL